MLSIIVLNYNRLEYTKQTIENLIAKTTVPHEFIFADNGSEDGTRKYLRSLRNKTNATNVRCVFNKSNHGVAGGRNCGLRIAKGTYLMTIDDDIIVPDNYDKLLMEACDNIPNLGITGVSVEGTKRTYVKNFNGVDMRVKEGNLGGGCLCLPRRVFERVGYYRPDFVYGGEDCDMYIRLKILGLISAYVVPTGLHIDRKENQAYVNLKRHAHRKTSKSFRKVGDNEIAYRKTGNVYVPYMVPKITTRHFDNVIKGKK